MAEPYANTLATVATGRTALVARFRAIASRIEELPLDAAAEVLVLLEPAVAPGRPGPRRVSSPACAGNLGGEVSQLEPSSFASRAA